MPDSIMLEKAKDFAVEIINALLSILTMNSCVNYKKRFPACERE